jgi:hypothetical protein
MRDLAHRLATAIARAVARTSDERLAFLERGAGRRALLATLPLGLRLLFRRRRADGVTGVIELRFADPAGGPPDRVEIAIAHGRCTVRRGASERPTATLSVRIPDMVRMAAGAASAPLLVQAGRLRLMGDVFLVMRFPALFGLPTRPLVPPQAPSSGGPRGRSTAPPSGPRATA